MIDKFEPLDKDNSIEDLKKSILMDKVEWAIGNIFKVFSGVASNGINLSWLQT